MTRPASEEDSDSAPEDISFKDAKNDALEQIKTVSEAAREKKKYRKEVNKRKQEFLAEQKREKQAKLNEIDSKKLPDFILNSISDEAEVSQTIDRKIKENKKTTFEKDYDSENYESVSNTEDFIALETDSTDFKVVSKKDLNSSKFKSSEAFNFRERMLFGNRVKREPYKHQIRKREKLIACGKNKHVSSQ